MEPEDKYDWWESMPTADELLAEHHTEFSAIVVNEVWLDQYRKTPKEPMPLEIALDIARVIWCSRNQESAHDTNKEC